MDFEKCSALLCALEHKSLSAAADKLGYTPSGISRMIAALEQDTGFPLLFRSRSGVSATPQCLQLLPIFQEIVFMKKQYDQRSAQIRGNEIGEIRIGSSYRAYYPWLIKLIAGFVKQFPLITIHIQEGSSSELVSAMKQHQLDLSIISEREGDFSWIPLQDNPLVAWLPPDHPYAEKKAFPLSAFETESYIDTHPDQETDNARIFKNNKLKPNIRFSTSDSYATYCLVEAGLGVSLNNSINAETWNGSVIVKPLEPPQSVTIGIAIPSSERLSPAAKNFVTYAEKSFKQHV